MVVAVLLTKETAEMMRSSKRKAAAAKKAKAMASASSTAAPVGGGGGGTGTPPLSSSPGRSPSRSTVATRAAASRAAAASRPLPTRGNSHDQQQQQQQRKKRKMKKKKEPQVIGSPSSNNFLNPNILPLPSPIRLLPTNTTTNNGNNTINNNIASSNPNPTTINNNNNPILLPPNPSFGEEDFRMLTMGIENMNSMGSIESVADLVDGIDRQHSHSHHQAQQEHQHQSSSSSTSAAAANNKKSYYMSPDKVEAASRAAAAVLSGSDGGTANHHPHPHHHYHPAPASAEALAVAMASTANATTNTAAAAAAAATANKDIIMNNGSNGEDSIVISSPSVGHSREDSNLSRPHSPESFLLDDSLLDPKTNLSRSSYQEDELSRNHSFTITPGASHTNNNNIIGVSNSYVYNPSPPTLDWECTNMDHFFDTDIAPNMTMTDTDTGSGGGGGGRNYTNKRKSMSSSTELDGDEKRSKLLYNDDSFHQIAGAVGPIPSFGVFGSLSNSSAEQLPPPHPPPIDPIMTSNSVARTTTMATTIALSPRNRLLSPQRPSHHHRPLPNNDSSSSAAAAAAAVASNAAITITNEHSHPSKGNLQHYNPTLYNQLKSTHPPPSPSHTDSTLPPLLVPHDRTGNRLAIVRGSMGIHSEYEIDDCGNSKMYRFYKFLREIYPALEGCTYLLPGLQQQRRNRRSLLRDAPSSEDIMGMGCTMNVSEFGSFKLGHVPGMTRLEKSKLSKSEFAIAKQRIECAICAFGGTLTRKQQPKQQPQTVADKRSIFRTRNELSSGLVQSPSSSAKSSLSSSSSSQGGGGGTKRKNKQQHQQHHHQFARSNSTVRQEKYEKKLRQQYFEHGNRLSWDVQANLSLTLNGAKTFDDEDTALKSSWSRDSENKRKNKCKKCGQIKQGHDCPYTSSLQRSIGVMVYPSANAHVADEPGKVAPALCEMNNFISIKSSSFEAGSSAEKRQNKTLLADDMGNNEMAATKISSLSDDARTTTSPKIDTVMIPFRRKTLLASPTIPATCKPVDDKRSDTEDGRDASKNNKMEEEDNSEDLLFQPKMEITPDQYRTVTPKKQQQQDTISATTKRDYKYPQVPLTFSQRKSMSDALFSLSKLVPKLTDECASVLTEARKRDEWDLAVAELMAQVICVLHCSRSRDYALDGLRNYLLTLGIVC